MNGLIRFIFCKQLIDNTIYLFKYANRNNAHDNPHISYQKCLKSTIFAARI